MVLALIGLQCYLSLITLCFERSRLTRVKDWRTRFSVVASDIGKNLAGESQASWHYSVHPYRLVDMTLHLPASKYWLNSMELRIKRHFLRPPPIKLIFRASIDISIEYPTLQRFNHLRSHSGLWCYSSRDLNPVTLFSHCPNSIASIEFGDYLGLSIGGTADIDIICINKWTYALVLCRSRLSL